MPQECNFLNKDRAVGYHYSSEALSHLLFSIRTLLRGLQSADGLKPTDLLLRGSDPVGADEGRKTLLHIPSATSTLPCN